MSFYSIFDILVNLALIYLLNSLQNAQATVSSIIIIKTGIILGNQPVISSRSHHRYNIETMADQQTVTATQVGASTPNNGGGPAQPPAPILGLKSDITLIELKELTSELARGTSVNRAKIFGKYLNFYSDTTAIIVRFDQPPTQSFTDQGTTYIDQTILAAFLQSIRSWLVTDPQRRTALTGKVSAIEDDVRLVNFLTTGLSNSNNLNIEKDDGYLNRTVKLLDEIVDYLLDLNQESARPETDAAEQIPEFMQEWLEQPVTSWPFISELVLEPFKKIELNQDNSFITVRSEQISIAAIREFMNEWLEQLSEVVFKVDEYKPYFVKLSKEQITSLQFATEKTSSAVILPKRKNQFDQTSIDKITETLKDILQAILAKKDPPAVAQSETPTPENDGGDSSDEQPTPPPILVSVDDVFQELVQEVADRIWAQLDLTSLDANQLRRFRSLIRNEVADQVTQLVLIYEGIQQSEFYDKDTKMVVVNAEFEQWVNQFVPTAVAQFYSQLGKVMPGVDNPAAYSVYLISLINRDLSAVEQPEEELTQAVVPDGSKLSQLASQYAQQAGVTFDPQTATPADRAQFVNYLRQTKTNDIGLELSRATNVALLAYCSSFPELQGLDFQQLPSELRTEIFNNLRDQLTDEDILNLLTNPTSARFKLVAKAGRIIRTNISLTTQLQQLVEQTRAAEKAAQEAKLTATDQELKDLTTQAGNENFDQNLDNITQTILLYSKDPNALIDSLDEAGFKKYGLAGLSPEQQARFKDLLKTRVETSRELGMASYGLVDQEQAEFGEDFDSILQSTNLHGHRTIGALWTRPLDEELSDIEDDTARQAEHHRRWQLAQQLWRESLSQEERDNIAPSPNVPDDFQLGPMLSADQSQPGKRRRKRPSLLKRANSTLTKSIADKAMEGGLNLLLPGLGSVISTLSLALPKSIRKYVLPTLGALTLGFLVKTAQIFFTHVTAAVFGSLGAIGALYFGPQFIPVGWAMGTWTGYLLEKEVISAAQSAWGATKSFLGLGESGVSSVSVGHSVSSTAIIGTTVGVPAVVALMSNAAIQTALLAPLPTIDSQGEISRYVTIEKVAKPGVKFDNPLAISYTISIKAKDNYQITLTDPPTDTVTIKVNEDTNPDGQTDPQPVLDNSPDYAAFATALAALSGTTIDEQGIILPSYTLDFGSGDFADTNITNTIDFNFDVTLNGEVIASQESAKTAEVICFGECPQAAAGCWPADGFVQQTPDNELETHNIVYAIDIKNKIGTPIFATYPGGITNYADGTGILPVYGYHSTLLVETGDSPLPTGFKLLFGHMHSFTQTMSADLGRRFSISPGTQIGYMGISGLHVLGPDYTKAENAHLHYEVRTYEGRAAWNDILAAGIELEKLVPPGEVVLGEFVRTCYQPQESL